MICCISLVMRVVGLLAMSGLPSFPAILLRSRQAAYRFRNPPAADQMIEAHCDTAMLRYTDQDGDGFKRGGWL
jgi:hypothetical protein